MRELFIYYRLQSIHAAAAEALVIGFQAHLRKVYPSLICRVLRRPEGGCDGQQTWMETYSTDPTREPEGVSADIEKAIVAQAAVLQPLLDGPRHIEVFSACVS